jgi:hypothetical protein
LLSKVAYGAIYNNGTLLRASGDDKIFVTHNNKKRWIRNQIIFNSYKFSPGSERIITKAEMDKIIYNNLVRVGGVKVYALNDVGYKRHIFNPDIFDSYGLSWADVADINNTEFGFYPDCNLIKQVDEEKVYYIDGTTRRWVKSIEAFNANSFKWEAIQIINATDMNHYTLGEDITGKISTVSPTPTPSGVTISTITPKTIINSKSNNITISGINFKTGATVKIGTILAISVTVVNSSTISATVPSGISPATYDVTISNTDGTAGTLKDGLVVALSIVSPTPTPSTTPTPLWEAP